MNQPGSATALLSAHGAGDGIVAVIRDLAVAAYAEIAGRELRLRGVSFLKGAPQRAEARGEIGMPEAVGRQLAKDLLG